VLATFEIQPMPNHLVIDPLFITPSPREQLDGDMPRHASEFSSAIADLMKEVAARSEVGGEYIGLLMFLNRARNLLQSIRVLTALGYRAEAFAVSRSMTEAAIDVAYILSADTKQRMDGFMDYIHVLHKQRQERLEGQGINVSQEEKDSVDLAFAQVSSNYNPKHRPWDRTLRARSIDADRLGLYETAYDIGCGASHSSPEGMFWTHLVQVTEGPDGKTLYLSEHDPRGPERYLPFKLACRSLVDLLLSIARYMASDSAMKRVGEACANAGDAFGLTFEMPSDDEYV
jgi:hypothetical protein